MHFFYIVCLDDFQLWDFATGQPLEMSRNEYCTASCLMNDNAHVVLGRTEKFGGGTTIVIWDLLANEAVRKLQYDGSVGFADYISYLSLSHDNRYVVAGFQNSYDGNANFIVFDLTGKLAFNKGNKMYFYFHVFKLF